MAATIPHAILGLRGQCVKQVEHDEQTGGWMIRCRRDRRFKPVDNRTGAWGSANRRLRREVFDLPIAGRPVKLDIEYYQIKIGAQDRRMERLSFAEPGHGYTHRFARFVSQLCRHMPISAVARYTGLAWRTVKAMDKHALKPSELTGLRILGVDEVARAKGHDYVTIVYNLENGELVWVGEGHSKDSLLAFFDQLDNDVAQGIEAVAMDMWQPFAQAVRASLPEAAIVYDRFHVMKQYSDVIDQVRRAEFKRAPKEDKALLTGSRYLLLKNTDKLSAGQLKRLDRLLRANGPLNAVYVLKEQLRQLWDKPDRVQAMQQNLERWCQLAMATGLSPIKRFVAMLRRHQDGICNYARYPFTTARLEGGNVAIGMIRRRARGLLDTEYFKLKIRQSTIPEKPLALYALS